MKNSVSILPRLIGVLLVICLGTDYTITAQTTSEAETKIPAEAQKRVDKAMNRLSQFAGLSEEQNSQIEPLLLEMLLQARIIIQDTTTPLETRQAQMTILLETTRLQIEPLLTQSQQAGLGMVWSRISAEVMARLEAE
jgi:hypothetical protein